MNHSKQLTAGSKHFSQKSSGKLSKSETGLKATERVDSHVLRNNLQEFYKTSKEKLLMLKAEVEELELTNQKQKEENNKLNLRYNEVTRENEMSKLRLKGAKELLVAAQKNRNTLQFQIKDLNREYETTMNDIDILKIDGNYKIKAVQNEIEHVTALKENNLLSIKKRIETERIKEMNLKEQIAEMKESIEKYKEMIHELSQNDSIRTKEMLKETDDMTKFLAEL